MRENKAFRYMKRSFLCPLIAVVSMLSCHLTMTGESIDSLYHVFLNADQDKRIEIVNNLSRQLYDLEITDTLYSCSSSTKAEMVDAMIHYLMAEHFYDLEQYEDALREGKQAEELTKSSKPVKFRSDVLGILSNAQYRRGDYDEALKTLLKAYQVDKALNDKRLISSDLNSLAAIYLAVGQPSAGISFIEKSIAIERELGRQEKLARRLGMASELYLLNDEPDKAMDAIKEAYDIDKKDGRQERAAIRLIQKGAILEHLSRLDEARSTILQALPELEKDGNAYSLAVGYNQMGSIEQKLGDIEKANGWYNKALEQSIICGSPKVERIAERGLWETMRKSNPNVALIHLERYTVLTDSIINEMASMQMGVLETTITNNDQQELDKKRQYINKLLKWGGLALVLMLTVMLGGLFASWRRGQKTLQLQRQTRELRKNFFDNITNQLQTPLTVVLGAGQEMLKEGKVNADENKRLGEMIVKHGKNMLALVNQLLDIEKVRVGVQPEIKQGDIMMFVRLLVDNFATIAHGKLINLQFSSPVNSMTVEFAPDYIRKIVHGLISNAIKFTPRNGSVHVRLSSPENGKMRLVVSDTGVGIPAEERDRIFQPFSQSQRGDEGLETAVDLSLVHQLVQALNGTITVDTEEGTGTTFTVDFPVQTAVETSETETLPSTGFAEDLLTSSGKKRLRPLVFIVDDNEDVAFFIANHLKDDYELRLTHDGREALNNALELVPALIITSLRMPVMDGKELIRKVRANNNLSHIPIIAMASDPSEQERLSCIKAGADAVLVKPFNSSELVLLTKHLIKQTSRMRERVSKTISMSKTEPVNKEEEAFITRLVEVIHAQLAKNDIDMNHIAAAMSMSPKQLRGRVTAVTGLTPVAYILQVRLNYAQRLIVNKDTSLTDIAAKCGFQNLSHFSKTFKQQFGVSPTQFRKNLDNINPPTPL